MRGRRKKTLTLSSALKRKRGLHRPARKQDDEKVMEPVSPGLQEAAEAILMLRQQHSPLDDLAIVELGVSSTPSGVQLERSPLDVEGSVEGQGSFPPSSEFLVSRTTPSTGIRGQPCTPVSGKSEASRLPCDFQCYSVSTSSGKFTVTPSSISSDGGHGQQVRRIPIANETPPTLGDSLCSTVLNRSGVVKVTPRQCSTPVSSPGTQGDSSLPAQPNESPPHPNNDQVVAESCFGSGQQRSARRSLMQELDTATASGIGCYNDAPIDYLPWAPNDDFDFENSRGTHHGHVIPGATVSDETRSELPRDIPDTTISDDVTLERAVDLPETTGSGDDNGQCRCACACCVNTIAHPTKGLTVLLSYEYLKDKPSDFRRMTGLNVTHFEVVYDFIGGDEMCRQLKYQYKGTPKKNRKKNESMRLSTRDRLLVTLVRLRQGYGIEDLALLFGVSKTLVGDVFFVYIQTLYLQFDRLRQRMFTTRAEQPKSILPQCLKPFEKYRCTIDTTYVTIEVPYNYQQQGNTYNQYRSDNVVNFLVACNCWGATSFVSPGFEGSMSDVEIFRRSGILDMLIPGDLILCDRGFPVEEDCDVLGVKLVYPPFKGAREVLSPEDELLTKKVAAARIHVERLFKKIKEFTLLKVMKNNMLPLVEQCFFVAACLVNFDPPNL